MLADLTVAAFDEAVGTAFRLADAPSGVGELELIEATGLPAGWGRPGGREPFSLTFLGPLSPALPQQVHRLEHPKLGLLPLFLVPLGPEGDPRGMHYQAVFN